MRDIMYALAHGLGDLLGLLIAGKLFWLIVLPALIIGAGATALLGYGVFGFLDAVR